MKKAFTLIAMLVIAVSATIAQTDTTVTTTVPQSEPTQEVVATQQQQQQQQPVSRIQAIKQQKQAQQQQQQAQKQQQQTAQQQPAQQQQQPAQQTSTVGLYKAMRGTYITFRGHAPYKEMPAFDGTNSIYWPKFGLQISAGQALSFFTYEGVLEYQQTMHPYYDITTKGTVIENINSLQGSIRIGAMLPIQLGNRLVLIPNVKCPLGGNFSFYSGWSSQFTVGVIGGLDFGIRLGGSKMVTLGFVYEYRWYVNRSTTFGIDFLGGQLGIIL